jgi:hypothetical protein
LCDTCDDLSRSELVDCLAGCVMVAENSVVEATRRNVRQIA